ncbi:hypothetical protein [Veillonella sp.]|jgi:antitoxin component of RelBE/YafQ-DinJ toxin-antitoxin module|uniref:hypothetical protein n=1 Tax=Veillonella sp. TaxID=1926307 RepID=UPI001B54DC92|nr:hypothetical protein [Veillonella sp.]MBP9550806.1 type II toxin-antitoxin system RelB/DinJ family antitoxin [Veillonella sp.]
MLADYEMMTVTIDENLKSAVEEILQSQEMNLEEAINLYFEEIINARGISFDVVLPPIAE